jgi:ribosomal protein S27AE
MATCVRTGCPGDALAAWWSLCLDCTAPLLEPIHERVAGNVLDQREAAGWDAVEWAERIAPNRWGNAATDDRWVTGVRCLAVASVVTGRGNGCEHTRGTGSAPVVAVTRATGSLRCPTCAEPLVAAVTTDGHACDRCGTVPVTRADRVAIVAGSSLIVVAQLCDRCTASVLALGRPEVVAK